MVLILKCKETGPPRENWIYNDKYLPTAPRGMRGPRRLGFWVRRNGQLYNFYFVPRWKDRDVIESMGYEIVLSTFRLTSNRSDRRC